jgi:hypothetical protein
MVGNENILVDFDCQNLILVNPNKVVNDFGEVNDRLINHENLVFYANLECSLFPRTRLAVGSNGNYNNETISIAKVNFLKPGNKTNLTNEYLDEITGLDTVKGKGVNQIIEKTNNQSSEKYITQTVENNIDTELLGITQIEINSNLSFMPEVTIQMEDIRGRALFEKGENSPYSVFFNYPYPLFYLTVKGYLGQAIKYQLALRTFSARFDTESGNFKITVKFYTYKYNILTMLPMKTIMNVPYMYRKKYQISPTNNANLQSSANQLNQNRKPVSVITSSKGYEKVREVYSDYKSKGLIPDNFPEITIQDLLIRLENLETYILNTFTQADLIPLTDAKNYRTTLNKFEGEVILYNQVSWVNKYLNTKDFYSYNNNRIYTFKKEIVENGLISRALVELKEITNKYNEELKENKTYGLNGNYTINNKTINSSVYQKIKVNKINPLLNNKDYEESYKLRFNKNPLTNTEDFNRFVNESKVLFLSLPNNTFNSTMWFSFDGNGEFTKQIQLMNNRLDEKQQLIQKELTEILSTRLSSSDGGLGFKPSIRNILAVILANTEAFIRLMCDVHESAWEQRQNKYRLESIIGTNSTVLSSDSKDRVQIEGEELNPVYPWPQYFRETNDDNGEKYELMYPGDATVISKTKGYLYDVWPEIEFIEEFLKADVLTKDGGSLSEITPYTNAQYVVNRVSLNSIDFPTSNTIFSNKQESKFLYEIWERLYLASFYQRFNKRGAKNRIADVISESEFINIQKSLGATSPSLTQKLKNYGFNSTNYESVLYNISNNGLGESWQKYIRGDFATSYIQQEIENSFAIFDKELLDNNSNVIEPEPTQISKLQDYLLSTESNNFEFLDTVPYNNDTWYVKNLANSKTTSIAQTFNTTQTLFYNVNKKMISNFTPEMSTNEVRPVVNFNIYKIFNIDPTPTQNRLSTFYSEKTNAKMYPTEGFINYSGNVLQTTSILNTPYFINSIQEGVNNWLNGDKNPYKAAAYLFLNSLPLSTLREKYKTYTSNETTNDLDYIFATFKKYGALHKVPYAFILKYGSIWHRYKNYVENGVDILQNVFTNFSAQTNYDPIGNSLSKEYNLIINGTPKKIVAQNTTTVGATSLTEINVGFYPKLINDFSVFLRGYQIFDTYSDSDIQSQLNVTNGFNLVFGDSSSFNLDVGYDPLNINDRLRFKTWSVSLQDSLLNKTYILPSFGTNINQVLNECIVDNKLKQPIKNNPSIFNGSVRTFWSLPNYGYFNNSNIVIATPEQYLKQILTGESEQQTFILNNSDNYTNIEEIFSIFDRSALDIMETEFLNFAKSEYDFEVQGVSTSSSGTTINKIIIDSLPNNTETTYKNFQLLIKELLSVNQVSYTNSENFINSNKQSQLNNANLIIQKFIEYDVVIKNGNPANYNRKVFESFRQNTNIIDTLTYEPYIENSLPTIGGTTTLAQSVLAYPSAWKALRTYVGFSSIDGLKYSDNGSFYTDFFVDMNIEFSEKSVKELAPLIKVYATQKTKNNVINRNQFVQLIENYLNSEQEFSNLLLNSLFQKVNKNLPNVSEASISEKTTAIDSEVTKLQLWEKFKSINDSWISGYDYKQTTFLEDVLILDRANRDIGNDILIDPYKVRILLTDMNESASVFAYINSIMTKHDFVTMMSPGYVNFYNVQEVQRNSVPKIEGTLEFANNLFGTFLNVDTRKASPKLICTYIAKPSEYPNMDKNQTFRFKNDAFKFGCGGDNPLLDKLKDKQNWGLTNRVVGFNVDIGLRNQNIFYRFNVSQDLGKQTLESMEQVNRMINQANGKKVATQNVSLWNFYTTRSYECEVESLGNALIQPTMYFNLQYVPMFNGPYHINEVRHVITPSSFRTTFKGIRQQIFALPKISNYIQSLTNQIFNDLVKTTTQSVSTNPTNSNTGTTQNSPSNPIKRNTFKIDNNSSNCLRIINKKFTNYISVEESGSKLNITDVINKIKEQVTIGGNLTNSRVLTFVTIYLATYNDNVFTTWNNNFCGARLDVNWRGNLQFFFNKEFICQIGSDGVSYPYAVFDDLNIMLKFMEAFWQNVSGTFSTIDAQTIFAKWKSNFNTSNTLSAGALVDYINKNQEEYNYYLKEIEKALKLAKDNSLY